MGVYTNVQAALDTQLNTIAGSPAIAWPNTNYTADAGTLFLRPHILPINSTLETLNDYHRYAGIYQVDINVPPEKGTATLNLWIDRVHDLFDQQTLTAGADTIFIQNITVGAKQQVDDEDDISFYRCNVDINFIVYS